MYLFGAAALGREARSKTLILPTFCAVTPCGSMLATVAGDKEASKFGLGLATVQSS